MVDMVETISSTKVLNIAEEAVNKLDVEDFIENSLPLLFQKLEECDASVKDAPADGDMMFIALALPIINGVIHIASNRKALDDAMGWVLAQWEKPQHPEAISILSGLALIHIVDRGWEIYKDPWSEDKKKFVTSGPSEGAQDDNRPAQETYEEKRVIWQRIHSRIQKLSENLEA